jgi:hypothetical protein
MSLNSNMNNETNQDAEQAFNYSPRPNIDHLIKRIVVERRKERKNTFITLTLSFLGVAVLAIFVSNG